MESCRGTHNLSNRALKFSLSVLSATERELPSPRIRSTSRPSRSYDAHLRSRFVPFSRLWDSVAASPLLVRGSSRVDRESSSSRISRFACEAQRPHPLPVSEATSELSMAEPALSETFEKVHIVTSFHCVSQSQMHSVLFLLGLHTLWVLAAAFLTRTGVIALSVAVPDPLGTVTQLSPHAPTQHETHDRLTSEPTHHTASYT